MRSAVLAILAFLPAVAPSRGAESEAAFANWPKTWVDAYQRFEKFIAAQKDNVPESDLIISPDGKISSSLPDAIDRETHTTIVFYREGADILEMAPDNALFGDARERYFPPGTYSTCLRTTGKMVGYQYIHPLLWFQVERAAPEHDANILGAGRRIIQMIEQPQPAMDYWPNDRLLRFCDFQVLPHINPLEFFRGNNKVAPSVTLAVTNAGVIQREKLDDAMEKVLQWRIYHNGCLVANGTAAGDLQHAATQGTGTYVAFVGVEGVGGFMPVSNFLQFPLFPERDGRVAVLPVTSSGDGVPDFLRDALAPEQMDRLRGALGWKDRFGTYNKATIYGLGSIGPGAADAKKEALIDLWSSWAWSVNLAKGDPASNIRRINMAPVAKPGGK